MTLPNPLVPANADLRNFEYMPLDVVRLRDSDFAVLSSAEAFRAGVLLWCASWHQVPAGSLPNDDRVLANLAGFGRVVKEWGKIKDEALQGWILCDDGRLYHPVVCEKVLESMDAKIKHQYGKFVDRMRKSNKKLESNGQPTVDIPDYEIWKSAGFPSDWSVTSVGIPAENNTNSSGKENNSSGIPAENSLKGTEQNRTEIKALSLSAIEYSPPLELVNTKLKMSGQPETNQVELDQMLVRFNLKTSHLQMVDNEKLGSLLTWFKNDRQRNTPTARSPHAKQRLDFDSVLDQQNQMRDVIPTGVINHEQ